MAEEKTIDERYLISRKRGNGQIRREVWTDEGGKVVRYNLAYINHALYAGDNGRVLGYDNNHGFHHKHFMGEVKPVVFSSMEELEERFYQEWTNLLPQSKGRARN